MVNNPRFFIDSGVPNVLDDLAVSCRQSHRVPGLALGLGFGRALLFLWVVSYSFSFLYARDYGSGSRGKAPPGQNVSAARRSRTHASRSFRTGTYRSGYHLKENADVRIRLQNLFTAPPTEVLEAPQTLYSQRDGNLPVMFQVRLNNAQSGKLYYAFVNRSYDENGRIVYPVSSRGSYLIRRDLEQDRIDQVKIFLTRNIDDKQSFIRVSPQLNGPYSELEVVIFNRPGYSKVPISIPFEEILTMPLHQFLKVTSKTIRWNALLVDPTLTEWQLVKNISDELRPFLYRIPEVYDGAMDANGLFVKIETGEQLSRPGMNCSGFIKWIADGVYRSRKNWQDETLYLDIEKLKRRQVDMRGGENPWNDGKEVSRDPYFGLDWARAIARELLELETKRTIEPGTNDVRDIPFFNYLENVGYPVTGVNTMMYLLAVKNPGSFYLGSINGTFGDPALHQYYHEVAFFPYFSDDGKFHLVVMDTGVERSEGFLEARYGEDYIHLSRIKAPYKYQAAPLDRQIAGSAVTAN
ncbi:hypothetical protein P0082_04060 [Candidatus Haliotispira prima]|uniref:Uncharacterized protein n=1 Tax=Candidatus Haliotispira prima TaxID=3034016 RepID=A0ABY8MLI6_9SPIO|nr:hypothetical protein P0082_04060 [Candidatus Haliotispira prima]